MSNVVFNARDAANHRERNARDSCDPDGPCLVASVKVIGVSENRPKLNCGDLVRLRPQDEALRSFEAHAVCLEVNNKNDMVTVLLPSTIYALFDNNLDMRLGTVDRRTALCPSFSDVATSILAHSPVKLVRDRLIDYFRCVFKCALCCRPLTHLKQLSAHSPPPFTTHPGAKRTTHFEVHPLAHERHEWCAPRTTRLLPAC
jgi:hypothetical protein